MSVEDFFGLFMMWAALSGAGLVWTYSPTYAWGMAQAARMPMAL